MPATQGNCHSANPEVGNEEYDMEAAFDIQEYMTKGVERVVSDALKATLKDPKCKFRPTGVSVPLTAA